MPEIGCYTMDLYCNVRGKCSKLYGVEPAQFTGRDRSACVREARKVGWKRLPGNGVDNSPRWECPTCQEKWR